MVKQTGSFILRKTDDGKKFWEGLKSENILTTEQDQDIILNPNDFEEQTLIRIFEPIEKI